MRHWTALTRNLLSAGATIHEMNTVRKHLSQIKGGQLARAACPATLVSLILSDVIGDDLDVIGSGPTVADRSSIGDAEALVKKFGLDPHLPFRETPKPDDAAFLHTRNLIIGSNRQAIDAAAKQAKLLGYRPLVLSTFVEGETREIARMQPNEAGKSKSTIGV